MIRETRVVKVVVEEVGEEEKEEVDVVVGKGGGKKVGKEGDGMGGKKAEEAREEVIRVAGNAVAGDMVEEKEEVDMGVEMEVEGTVEEMEVGEQGEDMAVEEKAVVILVEEVEAMEAFLSEESPGSGSLLEQAITASITANGRQRWDHQWETAGTRSEDSKIIDIDHFAPGFLTQADIMTAIGPMLAPRSDTFKIRARSQTYSKLGTPIESATIEAVLQRTPDTIVPTASINQPAPRIFKITSLRWLTDDQI